MEHVPLRNRAFVPDAKVTVYLLNTAHPEGAPKAAFFIAAGFSPLEPRRLIEALLAHIRDNPATEVTPVPFGTMYAIDAPLPCPDGRERLVRSVWIIEPSRGEPRLVTAYPAPRPQPEVQPRA